VTSSLVRRTASSMIRLGTGPTLSRTNRRASTKAVACDDTTRELVGTSLPSREVGGMGAGDRSCDVLTLPARTPNIAE
jgi:hypothetical protein